MTSTRNSDPDQFLMGGGGKSFKFDSVGRAVFGKIMSREMRQQTDYDSGKPKFWDDGNPMMQLAVALDTNETDPSDPEDDGERMIYIKGEMQKAVRQAVLTAGAAGLEIGGILQVTYIGDGPKPARGNPPKLYEATYTPAANAALMGAPAAPPAPPVYTPPAVAQPAPAAPPVDPAYAAWQAQQAAAAAAQPPAPPVHVATAPIAPGGVDPAALAALANLTPEQRAALGLG